jgi:hypothetical protein
LGADEPVALDLPRIVVEAGRLSDTEGIALRVGAGGARRRRGGLRFLVERVKVHSPRREAGAAGPVDDRYGRGDDLFLVLVVEAFQQLALVHEEIGLLHLGRHGDQHDEHTKENSFKAGIGADSTRAFTA